MKIAPLALACASACAIAGLGLVAKPAAQGAPSGTWSQKAPLPTARSEVSLALVNGKIYAIGGGINRVAVPHNEEYDIAADKWTLRMPMLRGLDHMGTVTLNGKIITIGGFTHSVHQNPQAMVIEYDPATDKWRELAPMKAPRASVAAAVLDRKIHAVGGRNPQGTTLATHEVYAPATNSWSEAAPLPKARDHMALVAADGKLHAIGGRFTSPVDGCARVLTAVSAGSMLP